MRFSTRLAAWGAALSFWGALLGLGAALDGYAQATHPVALLGARGVPRAAAFNALGFLLPGGLAATVAWRLRTGLPCGAAWTARIGASLALLAALMFALQGVLALDPGDFDAAASRAHAAVWAAWWLSFLPSAVLLTTGLRRDRARHMLVLASALAAVALVVLQLLPSALPALVQRAVFAVWFAWLLAAAHVIEPG